MSGRAMNLTPQARADEIRAGMRGLVGFKVPFTKKPLATIGAGKEWAAKMVEGWNYGAWSPVPFVRQHLSRIVGGVPGVGGPGTLGIAQRAADMKYDRFTQLSRTLRDASQVYSSRVKSMGKLWDDVAKHAKDIGNEQGFNDLNEFVRYLSEHMDNTGNALKMSRDQVRGFFAGDLDDVDMRKIDAFSTQAHKLVESMSNVKDMAYKYYRNLGGKGETLDDLFVTHFPRRPASKKFAKLYDELRQQRLLKVSNEFSSPRNELFRHFPGGTKGINDMARLDGMVGWRRLPKKAKGIVGDEYWDTLDPEVPIRSQEDLKAFTDGKLTGVYGYSPGVVEKMSIRDSLKAYAYEAVVSPHLKQGQLSGVEEKTLVETRTRLLEGLKTGSKFHGEDVLEDTPAILDDLVEYMGRLPDEARSTGLFDRTTMQDWMDYTETTALGIGSLMSVHNLFRKFSDFAPQDEIVDDAAKIVLPEGKENWVPLNVAWREVKSQKGNPLLHDRGRHTFVENMLKEDPKWHASMTEGINTADPEQYAQMLDEVAAEIIIDPRAVNAAALYVDPGVTNDSLSHIGRAIDGFNKFFKTGVTLPFPAFHVRNLTDGHFRNLMRAGDDTYGLKDFFRASGDFVSYMRHKDLNKLPFGREFWEQGGIHGHMLESTASASSDLMPIANPFEAILRSNPAAEAERVAQGAGRLRRAGGRALDVGRNMMEMVEFANRYEPYAAARRAGRTPAQAMALSQEIQYNYNRLKGGAMRGNFADTVMRRAVPFWGFTSRNIPYHMRQILSRPGGAEAQTLRAMYDLHREGGGYAPSWLKERIAIRVGGSEDAASYLSSFGLSLEDLSKVKWGRNGPNWRRTAESFASDLSPILSMPLKMYTGKDPYTGRRLEDLYSVTGNPLLDTATSASPFSRGVSTLRTITDPRKTAGQKALNLLTGMRIATHDLPKAKLRDLERINREIISEDPLARVMEIPYVPKTKREEAGKETLDALERMRRIRASMQRLMDQRL
jgi:hypothetical protein